MAYIAQGRVAGDVADQHALERANRNARGATQARSEPQEQRRVADVAHRDPCHGDVLHGAAIDRLEREAAAAFKDAVCNGNVPEAAVRFGAALDATGARPPVILGSLRKALEAAVDERADLVAARDVAIGDRDVLGRARIAESKRTLRADRIVPR